MKSNIGLLTLCFCLALAESDALWPTWSPLLRFHFTIKQRSQLIDSILGQRSLKRSKKWGGAKKDHWWCMEVIGGVGGICNDDISWDTLLKCVSVMHMFNVVGGWSTLLIMFIIETTCISVRIHYLCYSAAVWFDCWNVVVLSDNLDSCSYL